jgi:hypothetical protein
MPEADTAPADQKEIERLKRGRYEFEDVTLIPARYRSIRCIRCKIPLAGAPILVVPTDKGYKCADRTVCAWRRQREFQKRQLSFNFEVT